MPKLIALTKLKFVNILENFLKKNVLVKKNRKKIKNEKLINREGLKFSLVKNQVLSVTV